jgi:hypothetical protein
MADCFEDEVDLLVSVFSASNERVDVLSKTPTRVVNVRLSVGDRCVDLTFELGDVYPEEVPKIRIASEDLTRERSRRLAEWIAAEAKNIQIGD